LTICAANDESQAGNQKQDTCLAHARIIPA
jgi:hypothetical protein